MTKKGDDLISVLRELRRSWPAIKEMIMFMNSMFSPKGQERVWDGVSGWEDPYRVLGVSPGDDMEKIRAVYKRLAKIYHPDSETGNEEVFMKIQRAYEAIRREREG